MGNKNSIPHPPVVNSSQICYLPGVDCNISYHYVFDLSSSNPVGVDYNVKVEICKAGYYWYEDSDSDPPPSPLQKRSISHIRTYPSSTTQGVRP